MKRKQILIGFAASVSILYGSSALGLLDGVIARSVHVSELSKKLKDPDSLDILSHETYSPKKRLIKEELSDGREIICSEMTYNAKNSYGAYAGKDYSTAAIRIWRFMGVIYKVNGVTTSDAREVARTFDLPRFYDLAEACASPILDRMGQ